MSRGFYRVVFCGFGVGKNVGTLIVMARAFARYPGDLGKSKQATMQKVRDVHVSLSRSYRNFHLGIALKSSWLQGERGR